MGTQQSSEYGHCSTSAAINACYYDLLGVPRDANDEEVKKAYRRKALELHPDRNYGDAENATRRFAEVQTAYEILSDPQERAWYDSHRDAILRNEDPNNHTDACTAHFNNVHITTAQDIMLLIRRFTSSVPLTDEPGGFFSTVGQTFERIAAEEAAAAAAGGYEAPHYPSFGSCADGLNDFARQFYHGWTGFSSKKSFAWMDRYRPLDSPDRRTRRYVERENKRVRDEAIREFNDAVRFLVAFVRKRDPRMAAGRKTEAEREKFMREATAAQAAKSRAANRQKLMDTGRATAVPVSIHTPADGDMDGEFSDSSDSADGVRIECVVCKKGFKSENQYEAHERSRKHQQAVRRLRINMRDENLHLGSAPVLP